MPDPIIAPVEITDLAVAAALLEAACPFDSAGKVAAELLLGLAPGGPGSCITPEPLGAWIHGELAGVAVISGAWLRVLAVSPACQRLGVGGVLLAAAEQRIAAAGHPVVRVLDQPGNYLSPGIDQRNGEAVAWLERRGYQRRGRASNVLIDVRSDARVGAGPAQALAAMCAGYALRRATMSDAETIAALIRAALPATTAVEPWVFEVRRALGVDGGPSGVHVAVHTSSGEVVAFAAHDGNNRGLGWFGPAATAPAHRQQGLGAALLMACLVDVAAAGHERCEVAWIGPREFYERTAGIAAERCFIRMSKTL